MICALIMRSFYENLAASLILYFSFDFTAVDSVDSVRE
jgi:hypothetical protein